MDQELADVDAHMTCALTKWQHFSARNAVTPHS